MWLNFIERRTIEKASVIHLTSELEAEELKSFSFRFPEICVSPNGIDEGLFSTNGKHHPPADLLSRHDSELKTLLYLGRLNWKKGLDRLVEALSYLQGVRLVLAGPDEDRYQQSLTHLAEKFGVLNRVEFLGPVHGVQKRTLIEKVNLFVMPSRSENFSNAVLEAMALGCPVAVTRNVGLASTVEKSNSGILIDADPEKMALAIRDFLCEPLQLSQAGQNGKQTVREHFSWNKVAQRMESMYQKLVHNPSEITS